MNSKNYLGDFFRRKKAQKGYCKAITATARKIAVIYYTMLKTKQAYNDLGEQYYMKKKNEIQLKKLKKNASSFGYKLVLIND